MRVILALAALPLVVFALAPRVPVRASAPLAPTPVVSEGVGVIPLDARSFDARWWPDQAPTAVRVKTRFESQWMAEPMINAPKALKASSTI